MNKNIKHSIPGLQGRPLGAPAGAQRNKLKFKHILVIVMAIFMILFVLVQGYLERQQYAKQAQFNIEAQKQEIAARRAEEERHKRRAQEGLPDENVRQRLSSADLLKQSAQGHRPKQAEPEQKKLDFSGQVAAYEAQIKAQEDAEKERIRQAEFEKAEQERKQKELEESYRKAGSAYTAPAVQQQPAPQPKQQVQQPPPPPPAKLQSSAGVLGGSASKGASTMQPKPVQTQQAQPAAPKTQQAQQQQGTQLNKLETRRIYNN